MTTTNLTPFFERTSVFRHCLQCQARTFIGERLCPDCTHTPDSFEPEDHDD